IIRTAECSESFQKELHQPPNHQAFISSIQIAELHIVYHPDLWQRYQEIKKRLEAELQSVEIYNPTNEVRWQESLSNGLPSLNSTMGEVWLYHGTSESGVNSILQSGFNPLEYCKYEYTFYDGPPFAAGLPHYGHILPRTIKDTVTRWAYQTGHHVERRLGWGPEDVAKMGIATYNNLCRRIVMRYAQEWEDVVDRMGRWIDFRRDYKRMYPWFMESVWFVFKQLYEKGFVYQDKTKNEVFILMEKRLSQLYKKPDSYQILESFKGSHLKEMHYTPLFPYFANVKTAFRILCDDYVTEDRGTGVVHQAPYFGEDDYRVCLAHGVINKDAASV
ncbi:unnamed protein product, partial [Rotaria magnacalcarata]